MKCVVLADHDNLEWIRRTYTNVILNPLIFDRKYIDKKIRPEILSTVSKLMYIINFYETLPDFVICIDGNEYTKCHDGSMSSLLSGFFKTHEPKKDVFINFNNHNQRSIFVSYFYHFTAFLNELGIDKRKDCGLYSNSDWRNFRYPLEGSTQFIVSKQRILSRPLSFYMSLYDWLIASTFGFSRNNLALESNYFDCVWHLIFNDGPHR